jgi:hypothetical protein
VFDPLKNRDQKKRETPATALVSLGTRDGDNFRPFLSVSHRIELYQTAS